MKAKTNIDLYKPLIRIKCGKRYQLRLILVGWLRFLLDYVDYVCVHNKLPSVK